MPRQERQWRFASNAALIVVVLLAGAVFLSRGPVRFANRTAINDFLFPYIQSRAWISGTDPYSPQSLVQLWPPGSDPPDFLARHLADGSLVRNEGIPTAYPPTALLLIAPVALLPWRVAHLVWLAIGFLAFVVTVGSARSLAYLPWGARRTYVFLAFSLALAPFHTALGAGSIVIVAVAASVAAMLAAHRQHNALAGFLLVLSIGLKPQIGLPFLLYCLLRRRWRASAIAGAGVALLFALAVFRLATSRTPWIQNYLYDNRVLFSFGSLGDFTEKDPLRFGLINLQVVTYAILGNRDLANLLALSLAATMGLMWLFLFRRRGFQFDDLLALSALAVLSLMPMYHRLYDASLLILPLAWSFTALAGPARSLARATLLFLAVFLVPGGSALEQLQHVGHFATLQHRWWWNAFVMPHQAWTIFFLAIALLFAMRVTTDRNARLNPGS
ncbi:MAG: glycosyltransferase family 87 protein [Terriglobales bacterium]